MIAKHTKELLTAHSPLRARLESSPTASPLRARSTLGLAVLLTALTARAQFQPLGTEFTYQGRLNNGTTAANGRFDFTFTLCEAASGGTGLGFVTNLNVSVTNGLFTTMVDYKVDVFTGHALWLEIAVRSNGTASGYTTLQPRQPLTPTPNAHYARLAGAVPDASIDASKLSPAAVTGSAIADGQVVKSLNGFKDAVTLSAGANVTLTPSGQNIEIAASGVWLNWSLSGNAGTSPGLNFLGTTDDRPLEVRVGGARALLIEPRTTPNLIGGFYQNDASGAVGAAIAGGGASGAINRIVADYGFVGAGYGNSAGLMAAVGGGISNSASGAFSFVGGGQFNTSSFFFATVGGGDYNISSALAAMVGGGAGNTSSGNWATVGGGYYNTSSGPGATVGGGEHNKSSAWYATVGGGSLGVASGAFSTVGGGGGNFASDGNVASGDYSTVSGGIGNEATNTASTVAGGAYNRAGAQNSFVGGGSGNLANGFGASVGGGGQNAASGDFATVGGGGGGTVDDGNFASGPNSTVAGGVGNLSTAYAATVPGGSLNSARGTYSFAAGNRAKADHRGSFVWADSQASDFVSTMVDQFSLRAAGGVRLSDSTPGITFGATTRQMLSLWNTSYGIGVQPNTLYFRADNFGPDNGFAWFKGGSHTNVVKDPGPGGQMLMALDDSGLFVPHGDISWSAGGRLADNQGGSIELGPTLGNGETPFIDFHYGSNRGEDYNVRLINNNDGQLEIYRNALIGGAGTLMATLNKLGLWVNGTFVSASDRNVKAGFEQVDTRAILEQVATLPITRWHYTNDTATPHLGPVAQDFHAAFGVGPDDKHITTVDESGVALAAIQGLNQKLEDRLQQKESEIMELKKTLGELKELVSELAGHRNGSGR